jgi:hypothetical protein
VYKKDREIQTKGINNQFNEIITENFPNLKKERVTKVQEDYRTPSHQNQERNTSRHIIIKTLRTRKKERIIKAAKEKRQVTHKANPLE